MIGTLDKSDYNTILGRWDLEKLKQKVTFLKTVDYFKDWNGKALT
jgi:hypothetical protein